MSCLIITVKIPRQIYIVSAKIQVLIKIVLMKMKVGTVQEK